MSNSEQSSWFSFLNVGHCSWVGQLLLLTIIRIYAYIVCINVCVNTYATMHMWLSEDSFMEWFLPPLCNFQGSNSGHRVCFASTFSLQSSFACPGTIMGKATTWGTLKTLCGMRAKFKRYPLNSLTYRTFSKWQVLNYILFLLCAEEWVWVREERAEFAFPLSQCGSWGLSSSIKDWQAPLSADSPQMTNFRDGKRIYYLMPIVFTLSWTKWACF